MNNTIPIIIDSIRNYKNFNMTRCTYFSIESTDIMSRWFLSVQKLSIPFYLTHLCGIISHSNNFGRYFNSIDDINKIFEIIEHDPALHIDINEIWLPNYFFREQKTRGAVFRISEELFNLVLSYNSNSISQQKLINSSEQFYHSVIYSEKETAAFKKWSDSEIEKAKSNYGENKRLALEWNDNKGIKEVQNV